MSATTQRSSAERPSLSSFSERFAPWAVHALVATGIIYLSLDGGGYGIDTRSAFGIVVWLLILAVLVFSRGARRAVPGEALLIGGSTFAFAAVTGLSIFWSESAGRSFDEFARVLVYLGIVVGVTLAVRIAGRRPVLNGLITGVAIVVLLSVLSRLVPALFPAQEYQRLDPESSARLTFPLNYWNGLAAFFALAVPLFLYQATRRDVPPAWRALGNATLPVAGYGLYITFSRGGVATAVLACALVFAFSPRRLAALGALLVGAAGSAVLILMTRGYRSLNDGLIETSAARSEGVKVLTAMIAVCGIAYAAWFAQSKLLRSIPPRFVPTAVSPKRWVIIVGSIVAALAIAVALGAGDVSSKWESFKDPTVFQGDVTTDRIETRFLSGSGNGRYQYWSASTDAFESEPIGGIGAGTWEFWWSRNATTSGSVRDSHSMFFDVFAELGILGVMTVLAMFGSVIFVGARSWWRALGRPGETAAIDATLLTMAITFVFDAAIDWVWELTAVTALFFIVAGLLAWGNGRDEPRPSTATATAGGQPRRPARGGVGIGVAVAAVAWIALFVEAIPLLANWKIDQSQTYVREGDLDRAIRAAKSAHTIEPWAAEPYQQLAQVQALIAPDQTAMDYAGTAVRKEPTNWEHWFVLARIEAQAGQYDAAREHLEIARRLKPQSVIWQRPDRGIPELPPE